MISRVPFSGWESLRQLARDISDEGLFRRVPGFQPDYKRPEIVIDCVGPNKEVLRTFVLTAAGLQRKTLAVLSGGAFWSHLGSPKRRFCPSSALEDLVKGSGRT